MDIIRMGRENCKTALRNRSVAFFFATVCFCFGFFSFTPTARAEYIIFSKNITAQHLRTGYTFKKNDLVMTFPKGVFTDMKTVRIKGVTETEFPDAPADLRLISRPYVYVIGGQTSVLTQPLRIGIEVASDTYNAKALYFYDRGKETWQPLPSTYDPVYKRVYGASIFPSVLIAAFEKKNVSAAPALRAGAVFSNYDSTAMAVMDSVTGKILYEKNADAVRPLASLTKLVTADMLLDRHLSFSAITTYDSTCDRIGSRLRVSSGETMLVRDLWYSMLVGSANNATRCLLPTSRLTEEGAVFLMNKKAQKIGLSATHFSEVTGLDAENVSTAREFVRFAELAFTHNEIVSGTTVPSYSFTTVNFGIPHTIRSTNSPLFVSDMQLLGAKTGYIDESLYNQVAKFRKNGHNITVVLFGNANSRDRYNETLQIVREVFRNYVWP